MKNWDATSQLYIVDISLWDGSGFDIIRWLRKWRSKAPIIIVSGYGDSENTIYWLNLGADDFLIKPLIPEVLIARVKAILRRPVNYIDKTLVTYKDITFDTSTKETFTSGVRTPLTHKEALILETFITNQGKIVTRDRLITEVWGGHRLLEVSDNNINVMLSNVRRKLEGKFDPKAIYNFGYILE